MTQTKILLVISEEAFTYYMWNRMWFSVIYTNKVVFVQWCIQLAYLLSALQKNSHKTVITFQLIICIKILKEKMHIIKIPITGMTGY